MGQQRYTLTWNVDSDLWGQLFCPATGEYLNVEEGILHAATLSGEGRMVLAEYPQVTRLRLTIEIVTSSEKHTIEG